MPAERVIEHATLLLYALAMISGGIGGCAVASHGLLRSGRSRLSFFFAYAVIGMMFGALVLAYGTAFGVSTETVDNIIGNSLLAGAAGSISLASTNISARWVLKRLGIEVQVTVKKRGDE